MSFLPLQKTRWKYEQSWKIDSSWDISALLPLHINTLNTCTILSSWVVFEIPYPATSYKARCSTLLNIWRKLYNMWSHLCTFTFLNPTKQHIQHMNGVDMLSRCYEFDPPFPYRTLNMLFLPLQQNNTLNEWRACASGVIFEFLPPFYPTTQYVQHMKQIDMSSHSWNLPPQPYKAKGSTYEERWHVLFPTQVYLYGVLTPFEVLHAWAAWFFVCLPLVSHISYNGKKQRFSWEIGRFFLFYLFSC